MYRRRVFLGVIKWPIYTRKNRAMCSIVWHLIIFFNYSNYFFILNYNTVFGTAYLTWPTIFMNIHDIAIYTDPIYTGTHIDAKQIHSPTLALKKINNEICVFTFCSCIFWCSTIWGFVYCSSRWCGSWYVV